MHSNGGANHPLQEYQQERDSLSLAALAPAALRLGEIDSWGDSAACPQRNSHSLPCSGFQVAPASGDFVELPDIGKSFLTFSLLAELGRGTFGRVYLASQGELADRLVALKVSTEIIDESQKLARLQHTHIVPVYSLHRHGALQAVCMPYLGSTTLADVLHDLGQRESLPASGLGLVSTVECRKSRTFANIEPAPELPTQPRQPIDHTLLDRLAGLTYVEAVLWIGSSLASGLAHAHERGIVHRDLKPANVLLTDDGTPMLLDFNLAGDIDHSCVQQERVGGTLPYMAPEHLAAFLGISPPFASSQGAAVDERSDVFSLGVILYELLTRRSPYLRRGGPAESAAPAMLEDRLAGPSSMRAINSAITPAVESIIRHCLEADPAKRYQSAKQLGEDLERQRNHLPLKFAQEPLRERVKKWAKRHPHLSSTSSVAAVAFVLVLALGGLLFAVSDRLARADAKARHDDFRADLRAARLLLASRPDDSEQLAEGRECAQRALDRYDVLRQGERWQQSRPARLLDESVRSTLAAEVAEAALLLANTVDGEEALALNNVALISYTENHAPRALWRQRAALLNKLDRQDEAEAAIKRARQHQPADWERYLDAHEATRKGELREAITSLRTLVRDDPEHFAAWYLLGNCALDESPNDARSHFGACVALRPRFHGAWYNRGLANLRLKRWDDAEEDFTKALEIRPELARAYVVRALARESLGKRKEAISDLDEALARGESTVRVLLSRARLKLADGDRAGWQKDRNAALATKPTDEEGWVARGVARAKNEPKEALKDFDEALKLNPRSLAGWNNRAHILSEKQDECGWAIEALTQVLKYHPNHIGSLSSRAVLYARLGKREQALKDAKEALQRDGQNPATVYQVAGVYALGAKQRKADGDEALRLVARALRDGFGHAYLDTDPDLRPLHDDERFEALRKAAAVVRQEAK